jgi:hypothetical protein
VPVTIRCLRPAPRACRGSLGSTARTRSVSVLTDPRSVSLTPSSHAPL